MTASALYDGETWHRRFRPVEHFLRYRLFMLLLDLDELPALDGRLRHFGYNRSRLISFRDRDHLDGSPMPLRAQVEAHLHQAGLAGGGAIRVLCMPRVLGQVFNPLTVYYCYPPGSTEAPMAILYEVNNTFGQRHAYLLRVEADSDDKRIHNACDKRFYVSPFMDMALGYRFCLRPPTEGAGDPLSVEIDVDDTEGRILTAALLARRQELTDATLVGAVLSHPLLMLKVVGAIHWEAVKLWLKGMRLKPRPPAPAEPVTIEP
jgi:DUF1365 family protein